MNIRFIANRKHKLRPQRKETQSETWEEEGVAGGGGEGGQGSETASAQSSLA